PGPRKQAISTRNAARRTAVQAAIIQGQGSGTLGPSKSTDAPGLPKPPEKHGATCPIQLASRTTSTPASRNHPRGRAALGSSRINYRQAREDRTTTSKSKKGKMGRVGWSRTSRNAASSTRRAPIQSRVRSMGPSPWWLVVGGGWLGKAGSLFFSHL